MIARQAAEFQLFASAVDALVGSGAAQAAVDAADAAYREAERDLREAERREARARDRLTEAQDDLKEAQKAGHEAAEDADDAGLSLHDGAGDGPLRRARHARRPCGRPDQRRGRHPPARAPEHPDQRAGAPENWPGWAKSLFKIGRGEATVIAGMVGMAKKAYDDPDKIPGGLKDFGAQTNHDPIRTGKQSVRYDLLANGKWEDWMGQNGFVVLTGGAATAPARATRFQRVVGSPRARSTRPHGGADKQPQVRRHPVRLHEVRLRHAPRKQAPEDDRRAPARARREVSERGPVHPGRLSGDDAVRDRARRDRQPERRLQARRAPREPRRGTVPRRPRTTSGTTWRTASRWKLSRRICTMP